MSNSSKEITLHQAYLSQKRLESCDSGSSSQKDLQIIKKYIIKKVITVKRFYLKCGKGILIHICRDYEEAKDYCYPRNTNKNKRCKKLPVRNTPRNPHICVYAADERMPFKFMIMASFVNYIHNFYTFKLVIDEKGNPCFRVLERCGKPDNSINENTLFTKDEFLEYIYNTFSPKDIPRRISNNLQKNNTIVLPPDTIIKNHKEAYVNCVPKGDSILQIQKTNTSIQKIKNIIFSFSMKRILELFKW